MYGCMCLKAAGVLHFHDEILDLASGDNQLINIELGKSFATALSLRGLKELPINSLLSPGKIFLCCLSYIEQI